ILVMTVEPGFGGQELIPECLDKVKDLKQIREKAPSKYHYLIQIDGGVNQDTIEDIVDAGVDVVVAGSFIYKSRDYSDAINILKGN
ncbi:MAG: ribulose-phosphate 3-epimerase, partial [Candidatus Lokiarchaeota archaeon]|nr:ribulose-phosphate 3-epimerase [Candidatus Lokiarchaeota archaeon]